MANAVTHQNPVRKALADLVVGNTSTADWNSGTAQKLVVYSGTVPANGSAALSGNTAIATITAVAWTNPASTSGVATVSGSTADPAAVGGTATFFREYRTAAADPGDVIFQGSVGTSGCDLNLNSVTIAAGANVSLTGTNTYTAPV